MPERYNDSARGRIVLMSADIILKKSVHRINPELGPRAKNKAARNAPICL